jgi:hypothetical protein
MKQKHKSGHFKKEGLDYVWPTPRFRGGAKPPKSIEKTPADLAEQISCRSKRRAENGYPPFGTKMSIPPDPSFGKWIIFELF